MLQTLSDLAESKCLHLRYRDILLSAVCQYARQLENLRQPAAILFLFHLDLEAEVLAPRRPSVGMSGSMPAARTRHSAAGGRVVPARRSRTMAMWSRSV